VVVSRLNGAPQGGPFKHIMGVWPMWEREQLVIQLIW